jgi:TonB-linked SusC/RagA family outer membrane protein
MNKDLIIHFYVLFKLKKNVFWGVSMLLVLIFSNKELQAAKHASPSNWPLRTVYQKAIIVTGKISDQAGNPLPGVSVKVKNETTTVASDATGAYKITVAKEDAILVFSYIGFIAQEQAIPKNKVLNITLVEKVGALDELVIIGYGTQQRKDLTTSVSTIKAEDIENIPVSTPQSLIQGRAAGVQVIQNSGAPGGEATIRVRGTTSINAGNDPLYIVDGVPVESNSLSNLNQTGTLISPLASINANDIESMEILKDAGALAVYGSRGANGVVLITTKRGKAGRPTYSLSTYQGFQKDNKATRPKAMSSEEFIEKMQEQRANVSLGSVPSPLYGFILPLENGTLYNTDWQDAVFRTAPIANYDFSVRGGENKIKVALSASYFDQKGIVIFSGMKRYTTRFNMDFQASKTFKLGASLAYSKNNADRATTDDSANGLIWNAINKSPVMPIYNPDGTFYNDDPSGTNNPINFATNNKYTNKMATFTGNVFGEYTIVPNLVLRSTLGINNAGVTDSYFVLGKATRNGVTAGIASSAAVDNWVNENTLSYRKRVAKKHLFTGLLGYSLQERTSFVLRANARGFGTDNIPTLNAGTTPTAVYSFETSSGLSSAFVRVGYTFDDRYLFEGTIRRDGSSRFGENRKYALFPAASAAWRVSNEGFMKAIPVINDLKIRASLGRTGNQTIGDYISQGEYGTNFPYMGVSGIALSTIPNPDLTWELTTQYNAGLDISLFQSRISFTAEVYVKNTANLLLNVPLPGTTGFTSILQNIGRVQNKGLEFGLQTENIKKDKFNWKTNFNISFNRNKVQELYSGEQQLIVARGSTFGGSLNSYSIIKVGESIGSFYGWEQTGVYAYTTDNTTGLKNTSTGTNNYVYRGGDIKFTDLNGNNAIDFEDRLIIGNAQPKFTGGLTNNFRYQAFDLSVLNTFSYGNDIVNGTRYNAESMTSFNGSKNLLRRWRNEGDITDVPMAIATDPGGNSRFSTRWIEDGSYFRIKTLTLGYTLPKNLISKAKLTNLRVYVTGQNLLTLTKYTGYDPELSARFSNNVTDIGIDQGTYPQYRSMIFGINIGL